MDEFILERNLYLKNIDILLIEDAKRSSKKWTFLCLRCKVSYFISKYIQKLYKNNSGCGISLNEMALKLLEDDGSSYLKIPINEENKKAFKEIENFRH